jgi:hypothetical protein
MALSGRTGMIQLGPKLEIPGRITQKRHKKFVEWCDKLLPCGNDIFRGA